MTLIAETLGRLDAVAALPGAVEACAAQHFADAIGVGLAAAGSAAGTPWQRYGALVTAAPGGPASVLGLPGGSRPAEAALVNGSLIHSLEFDDTHTGSIAHGSAVLAAAALAAGEATGASGQAILREYALWYEVLIRLGGAAAGGFQARGFQLTSVAGALCAAGLAARLGGADARTAAHAIGIALSQASGVFEFLSDGSTVKAMHPGWAAHAGLVAADLAQAGVTGPGTALEGRWGLFAVFAGARDAAASYAAALDGLGREWLLQDAAFKLLPCCHYIHPFVEAAADLARHGATPETIAELVFEVPQGAAAIICEPWEQKQRAAGHAARWSLPVVAAMQIAEGRVGLDSFERAPAAGVADLAARSRWQVLAGSAFPARFDARLTVRLTDGRQLATHVADALGNASRPASEADLAAKFRTNLARLADEGQTAALTAALDSLPGAADARALTRALRAIGERRVP